jgi:hypothetical protein
MVIHIVALEMVFRYFFFGKHHCHDFEKASPLFMGESKKIKVDNFCTLQFI